MWPTRKRFLRDTPRPPRHVLLTGGSGLEAIQGSVTSQQRRGPPPPREDDSGGGAGPGVEASLGGGGPGWDAAGGSPVGATQVHRPPRCPPETAALLRATPTAEGGRVRGSLPRPAARPSRRHRHRAGGARVLWCVGGRAAASSRARGAAQAPVLSDSRAGAAAGQRHPRPGCDTGRPRSASRLRGLAPRGSPAPRPLGTPGRDAAAAERGPGDAGTWGRPSAPPSARETRGSSPRSLCRLRPP